jgi:hypothetical protein
MIPLDVYGGVGKDRLGREIFVVSRRGIYLYSMISGLICAVYPYNTY